MICPFCKNDNDKVVDSRVSGTAIRRRRECLACGRRFTTREYIEMQPLTVVKRSGEKEPFQREKLIRGIMNSCKKRPLTSEDIEELATRVENALPVNDNSEVGYDTIGNLNCRNVHLLLTDTSIEGEIHLSLVVASVCEAGLHCVVATHAIVDGLIVATNTLALECSSGTLLDSTIRIAELGHNGYHSFLLHILLGEMAVDSCRHNSLLGFEWIWGYCKVIG